MKIDKEVLRERVGDFTCEADLYYYVENILYYLRTHNKNYTKKQEYYINEIADVWASLTND